MRVYCPVMHDASRASILQGLSATTLNPLRTLLATLGIVIGVASVIATLALADGFERLIREQVAAQTDVQAVVVSSKTDDERGGFAYPVSNYPVFATADAADLQRHMGARGEVTMSVSGQAVVTSADGAPHAVTVTAALANFLAFGHKDVEVGRFFTDGEATRNAPVVVLSHLLAAEMSPSGDPAQLVGRDVRINGRPRAVVGVMPPYLGERSFQVYVPVRAAATTFASRGRITPALVVRAPSLETVTATSDVVEEWLATRYRNWEQRVTVTTSLARLAQARTAMLVLKLLMGALAGISLIVGGVGIMNVLLASVTERTREIGVRKALGARKRDILYQFLTESVAIASVGSGVGMTFGFIGAIAVAAVIRTIVPGAMLYAAFTAGTLLVAVLSAAIIGLAFGTFPALRASRLSPIDAIRHE
ncbi:MAG: ABC transporter permease [bacterium]